MKATLSNPCDEVYTLEWLDLLVHFTLNPEKHFVETIPKQEVVSIKTRLTNEFLKIRKLIQQQMFSARSQNEAELLIRNYHSALTIMLSQSFSNIENISVKNESAYSINRDLLQFLEDLISMVENRFSMYMSMDEYVPKTYFRLTQKELSSRLQKVKTKISINNPQKVPLEIIVNKLNRFMNTNEFEYTTSYKKIMYKKKLITEVEKIDFSTTDFQAYTSLDIILIYLNFNSVEYLNYLIAFIKRKVSAYKIINEKMKELRFLYKSFNQLHKRPDVSYNQNFHSVEILLNNWFSEELAYLEKLQLTDISVLEKDGRVTKEENFQTKKQKIICNLSSDQIGLILRASDELRILAAKSLSEVFKTIVPHLSTPYNENLSYDGMRSKSYVAEERDKQITVEALEKIILKIKEY